MNTTLIPTIELWKQLKQNPNDAGLRFEYAIREHDRSIYRDQPLDMLAMESHLDSGVPYLPTEWAHPREVETLGRALEEAREDKHSACDALRQIQRIAEDHA